MDVNHGDPGDLAPDFFDEGSGQQSESGWNFRCLSDTERRSNQDEIPLSGFP